MKKIIGIIALSFSNGDLSLDSLIAMKNANAEQECGGNACGGSGGKRIVKNYDLTIL